MAFDAYDDYEQGERVQKWLRDNSMLMLAGIVIALMAIFGWKQWRNHQFRQQMGAAQMFATMTAAQQSGHTQAFNALVTQLMQNYADSPYAMFAVSARAASAVRHHHLKRALLSLEWAHQHSPSTALKALTELRMARVQLAQGDAKKSLATLQQIPSGSYTSLVQELRGDTLVQLKRYDDAYKAYQVAITSLQKEGLSSATLEMKMNNLPPVGSHRA